VLRKAILGLLEVVAELEHRLVALEPPSAATNRERRLAKFLDQPTPDQPRPGDRT